jgi:hypothetical protein
MGRIMTQNCFKIRENFKYPAMQAASTISNFFTYAMLDLALYGVNYDWQGKLY